MVATIQTVMLTPNPVNTKESFIASVVVTFDPIEFFELNTTPWTQLANATWLDIGNG